MNLFRKNIFLRKTIREVSILLKKDYPNTYNAIMELEKEGVIKTEKVGKSKVCSVMLNQKTISLFSFLDEQEALEMNVSNIEKILDFQEFNEDILLLNLQYFFALSVAVTPPKNHLLYYNNMPLHIVMSNILQYLYL